MDAPGKARFIGRVREREISRLIVACETIRGAQATTSSSSSSIIDEIAVLFKAHCLFASATTFSAYETCVRRFVCDCGCNRKQQERHAYEVPRELLSALDRECCGWTQSTRAAFSSPPSRACACVDALCARISQSLLEGTQLGWVLVRMLRHVAAGFPELTCDSFFFIPREVITTSNARKTGDSASSSSSSSSSSTTPVDVIAVLLGLLRCRDDALVQEILECLAYLVSRPCGHWSSNDRGGDCDAALGKSGRCFCCSRLLASKRHLQQPQQPQEQGTPARPARQVRLPLAASLLCRRPADVLAFWRLAMMKHWTGDER